jgi:hypothetical protein
MPQLIENKQNDLVLIANLEPNEIATKSEEKTKIQTRKHCADGAAQKEAKFSRANESSRRLPRTRLLDLPGSTNRRPGSPFSTWAAPGFFCRKEKRKECGTLKGETWRTGISAWCGRARPPQKISLHLGGVRVGFRQLGARWMGNGGVPYAVKATGYPRFQLVKVNRGEHEGAEHVVLIDVVLDGLIS